MSITLRIDKFERKIVPEVDYQLTRIIQHNKAVICFFADGSKTVSIPSGGDEFDLEKGVAMCVTKRVLGGYSGVKRAIEGVEKVFECTPIQSFDFDNDGEKIYDKFLKNELRGFFIAKKIDRYLAIAYDDYRWFSTESGARAWLRERGAK